MKKSIKYVLAIKLIICLTILLTSCQEEPKNNFIALGDSVAYGYGLSLQEESYPAIFYSMLENEEAFDNYYNLAVNGFTTTKLLEYLNNISTKELNDLKNARIVTLNIGGNNVLVPFMNYLSNLQAVTGMENIISGTSDILEGYLDIIDIIYGSFSPELTDELEKGITAFSDEFKEIITWIEKNAPKATIIVNTVYNPVPPEVLMSSIEISIIANMLVESMNNIIIQESKSRRYLVSDIYANLSNQLDMMIFNINPFIGDISFDIVHPNADGHRIIAQLNYETFMQR